MNALLTQEDNDAIPYRREMSRRVNHPQVICPLFETFAEVRASWARNYYKRHMGVDRYSNMDDQQVLEDIGVPIPPTREDFLAERERLIGKFVEFPCIPLVRKLLDHGKLTRESNAFGPSYKGVWWVEDYAQSSHFFTSLISGKTFEERSLGDKKRWWKKIYLPHDAGIDFSDCLATPSYFRMIGMAMPHRPGPVSAAQKGCQTAADYG